MNRKAIATIMMNADPHKAFVILTFRNKGQQDMR